MNKKNLTFLLYVWILIHVLLFLISFWQVRNSNETITFILWAYVFGAFVWEDLLIFSIFNIVASVIILNINDFRYVLIFPLVFWIVRSAGEVVYWFLQQFNQPTMYPHNQYDWNTLHAIQSVFGNISNQKFFILFQTFQQSILIFCLVMLVGVLKRWKAIGKMVNA